MLAHSQPEITLAGHLCLRARIPEDLPMIPDGSDLWLKTAFGLAAVLFLTSLPTWALGVILVLGLLAKAAVRPT